MRWDPRDWDWGVAGRWDQKCLDTVPTDMGIGRVQIRSQAKSGQFLFGQSNRPPTSEVLSSHRCT